MRIFRKTVKSIQRRTIRSQAGARVVTPTYWHSFVECVL